MKEHGRNQLPPIRTSLANYQTLQSGSRISEPTRVRVNSTGEHAAPDNVFRISLDSLVVKNRIPLAIHSYSGPVQTSDMSPRPVCVSDRRRSCSIYCTR